MGDDTQFDDVTEGTSAGDRWLIVGFVISLLLGLAVLGWHYRSTDKAPPICANAEARCGDRPDAAQ